MTETREEPPTDQQQNRAERSVLPDGDRVDQRILNLLLFEPGVGLWATHELEREIGSRIDVDDSLHRLHRAGLIHRLDEQFVFASRTAAHAAALLDPESQRGWWTRGSRH